MSRRAAHRYAKAIIELAQEHDNLDAIYEDMDLVYNTIARNHELKAMLRSPVIKLSTKLAVVADVFKQTNALVQDLFKILTDNNRIDILMLVADEYMDAYKDIKHIQEAEVITAVPLTPEVEAKVNDKIKAVTGYTATIDNLIDASILGGFIFKVKDLQYNASARGNLNALKREFLN
ncbi:MAG: ATP synthase F1 subunit delta [Psychroflexus sp.]|nr:ATP synthase F1 subunit delta [Psychroflexus sp.]MDN6309317.1 ATP synthase F1 subunit delta [Psychroflexus sp.]